MGLNVYKTCPACKRDVHDLFDLGWTSAGQNVILGRVCEDCAIILKGKLEEMVRHIQTAKLN